MAECKIPVIAVVGPTASGKTSLAVSLCERLGGEAVSCDSMQIYKGMDVATAAPTVEEMHGVPHHLIGFLSPTDTFSVVEYKKLAAECIADITDRGKVPVIVGGTGLYYSLLVDNVELVEEETDSQYRSYLQKIADEESPSMLLAMLREIDPETASQLHENNVKRIIRALEVYHSTGMTMTEQKERSRLNPSPYDVFTIGLDANDRDFLYERINRRVDIMLDGGLVAEAKAFYAKGFGSTSCQAIGYKELKPYLDGEATLESCVENLKMQTRRYAKRQLTWFRRDERIKWLHIDEYAGFGEISDKAFEMASAWLESIKKNRQEG